MKESRDRESIENAVKAIHASLDEAHEKRLDISTVVAWHGLLETISGDLACVRGALTDDAGELIGHGEDAGEIEDFQWAARHVFSVLENIEKLRAEMDIYVLPELRRVYWGRPEAQI